MPKLIIYILFISSFVAAQQLAPIVLSYKKTIPKGYYFITPYSMDKTKKPKNIQLITDEKGDIIVYRNYEKGTDFKIHPNGKLSYFSNNYFFILNHKLELLDSITTVDDIEIDAHDFLILPNGHYLLIGKEKEIIDYSNKRLFMQKKVAGSKRALVKYDVLQEFDETKKLVYQWNSKPFFKIEDADEFFLNDTAKIDVTHFNSVDVDKDGNFLISVRYFNQVIKVNKKTGELFWRFGGKTNDVKLLNDSVLFFGQHDARYVSKNAFTLFDNGYSHDSVKHNVRATEYIINDKEKTARVVWNYSPNKKIISEANGNVQRLSKKMTLVSYGKILSSTANITSELISKKGDVISTLFFTDTCGTYRTFFYKKKNLTIKQEQLIEIEKENQVCITPKNNYKYYQWSTGETTSEIRVTKTKNSSVYVFLSNDGKTFIRSKEYVVKMSKAN